MASLFDRLNRGRPAPPPEEKTKVDPAQKLLDFLLRWPHPTICAREILMYGPSSTRKQKNADDATRTLQKYGWIIPLETNQHNWRRWQIIRQPTVHPKIAG